MLEPGFYWVKCWNDWTIGEYTLMMTGEPEWFIIGVTDNVYVGESISEIGPKIENYEKNTL